MADKKKQKKPVHFTPRCVFKYVHLNRPDRGTKEHPKKDPEFSVTVLMDKDDPKTTAFIEKIEAMMPDFEAEANELFDSASPKVKAKWKQKKIDEPQFQPFYSDELDEDGDPTGNVMFRFKTKAFFKDEKTGKEVEKTVALIDGRGEVIPTKKRPMVYAGTEGKIAFTVGMAFIADEAKAFVSFYLSQVQILKLVSSGGGARSLFGADEDSDFSASDLEEKEDEDEDTDDDLEDDGSAEDDDEIPF